MASHRLLPCPPRDPSIAGMTLAALIERAAAMGLVERYRPTM
ncbi:hypothetical protein [Sphingomonas hankookensis]